MTYPADNRRNGASCGPLKKVEDALEANDSQRSGSECRLMEAWGDDERCEWKWRATGAPDVPQPGGSWK